jgi:hypothetical protein
MVSGVQDKEVLKGEKGKGDGGNTSPKVPQSPLLDELAQSNALDLKL